MTLVEVLDVSILEVDEGSVQVKSTNGDTHLGGDDVDQAVIEWLLATFKKENGIDISKDNVIKIEGCCRNREKGIVIFALY